MLELYDIEMMYNITGIIESHDTTASTTVGIAQKKCNTLIDVQNYLYSKCEDISYVCLSKNTIKQMYKLYKTCAQDASYVMHINGIEIMWSNQRKKYIVNDRDILYYSIDDKEELLGYIIHKLDNVIVVPRLMNIFMKMEQTIQSFSNYIACCNYIKQVRNSIYDLNHYNWFTAQMKLYYSSKDEI